MLKRIAVAATVTCAFAVAAVPASALTTKEKMDTCKFGADHQKLKGKARSSFIAKCMANEKPAKKLPAPPKPAQ
ncbi:MAG TPA: PsiF family protein [Pseudolabrys sp.]|nr:PsiF family protein [Pseudolabrys sp.]